MNLKKLIEKFIKIKKEQLSYISYISNIIYSNKINENEILKIYRNLKKFEQELNKIKKNIFYIMKENNMINRQNYNNIIIEFDIDNDYLSSLKIDDEIYKELLLNYLEIDIDNLKYKLTIHQLIKFMRYKKTNIISSYIVKTNQKLLDKPIYIFAGYDGYYDSFTEENIYGLYKIPFTANNDQINIKEDKMYEFENNKRIIKVKKYVNSFEVEEIFNEELMNLENDTIDKCIIKTEDRIKKLNYYRSPKYKEKLLLKKLEQLNNKIMAKNIKHQLIFNGNFFKIIKESYTLLNNKTIEKERIIKNNNKNNIIIVAITKDQKYILTFKNRIKNQLCAEFPFGYIEKNEDILTATKRILTNEVGYNSDDLREIDSIYTSPGIDNSISYIVIAKDCEKIENNNLLKYKLFSELELQYLINNKIINGTLNKLAYYTHIYNNNNKILSFSQKK